VGRRGAAGAEGQGAPAGTRDRNLGSRLRPRPARGPRGRAERRRWRLCRRLRGSRGAQSLSTPPRPCHKSAPRSPFLTAGCPAVHSCSWGSASQSRRS
jgi:hypothetical protein